MFRITGAPLAGVLLFACSQAVAEDVTVSRANSVLYAPVLEETSSDDHDLAERVFGRSWMGGLDAVAPRQTVVFTELTDQWNLHMIGVQAAYDRGYDGAGVIVGVVDSGVEADHHQLASQMVNIGLDSFTGLPSRIDEHGHGTHVAGIIAGARDGRDFMGVAPGAKLASMRLLDARNAAGDTAFQIPLLYHDALDAGVRIFNNSWGCCEIWLDATPADILQFVVRAPELNAYRRAVELDSILIWATGNESQIQPGVHAGLPYYFPELQANWLAVTAVGSSGALASYANRCGAAAQWCLAAPGGDLPGPGQTAAQALIVSAGLNGTLAPNAGTSMAAPHVAGAAAIARQMFPNASGAEIVRLILVSSTDIGTPGVDEDYGWGLLNVANIAVTLDARAASIFANGQWAAREAQLAVTDAVADRLSGRAGRRVWGAMLARRGSHDATGSSFEADADTSGLLIGADLAVGEFSSGGSYVFGAALGASRTELTESVPNEAVIEGLHLIAYGAAENRRLFLEGSAGVHRMTRDTRRGAVLGASGSVLEDQGLLGVSRVEDDGLSASLRGGLKQDTRAGQVRFYMAARVTRQSPEALSETGADVFTQSAPAQSTRQYEAGPGVQLETPDAGGFRAWFGAEHMWRWGDRSFAYQTDLMGSPVPGAVGDLGDGTWIVSGEIRHAAWSGAEVFAGGRYAWTDRAEAGGATLGLRIIF